MYIPEIVIDDTAGFCYGVDISINRTEEALLKGHRIYAIGSLVHNTKEMERLGKRGLKVINAGGVKEVEHDAIALIRAHGEPPSTYKTIKKKGLELIDGTCPTVLRLQAKIRMADKTMDNQNGTIIIYGNKDHPEVIALNAQSRHSIVINSEEEALIVPIKIPVRMFAQTTSSEHGYNKVCKVVESRVRIISSEDDDFIAIHSICKIVSGRSKRLEEFVKRFDAVVFVASSQSSNGKNLFSICKQFNVNSYFVQEASELSPAMVKGYKSIGISGATSTPQYMLEEVRIRIKQLSL